MAVVDITGGVARGIITTTMFDSGVTRGSGSDVCLLGDLKPGKQQGEDQLKN